MPSYDPGAMGLAAIYAQAGLGNTLVNKGVLTEQELYQSLHYALNVMQQSGNVQEPEVRQVLQSLYPAAGL